MSKIYTKTGDNGTTGLVSGNRISKADLRIDLYGDVDELNSVLGFCVIGLKDLKLSDELQMMLKIQSALFDLGSNLACEVELREKYKLPQIQMSLVKMMEESMDKISNLLPALKNFILPGGSTYAVQFHVARTICRRVERKLIHYKESTQEDLPMNSIVFLNRLSDLLFVYSRYCNFNLKENEIEWKPFST